VKQGGASWAAPLALLGAVSLWGVTPTATRHLVETTFDPGHILVWRFAAGGLLSIAIIALLRPAMPSRRDLPLAVGLGLFGVLGFNVPLAYGVNLIEGGIAALLLGTQPGFTAVLAVLLLGESLSRRLVIGLGVALAGTVLVALSGATRVDLSTRYLVGCLLVLAASLAYALYTIAVKPYLGERIPAPAVAMIGTTAAFPFVLPLGASGIGEAVNGLDLSGWLAAILLAAGASVVAPVLFNLGLSLGRASHAGTYLYLVPVFGALSSAILLDEHLSALTITGGALVVLGVAIATLPRGLLRQITGGARVARRFAR
jgi:drug/metabolite transporter (DMT)-like permease